ncbi:MULTISPECIES: MFS transporter [Cupriavidus]|uniref:General substrate transporter:Major facilitator superfamily MFS_1 n=1 Tax=Cupriavidus pinatubonensis (strain JMP 134 / LMG 1197) TaxID=264198 RepID=Q46ZD7_CUPPJ|nr:MFS transporter [Cupriavidus pinatubonensis]TPQ34214.1 MFS transporter [Cupriavidus pinatubonensis]
MLGHSSTQPAMVTGTQTVAASRFYPWLVFALSFGLLLSDYMSRQVLNAVFPLLKAEWALSDTELGALGGIVALMVGLLTFPLSILADRWGRVKSLTLMAALWSVATLGCALANNFGEMFIARLCVGIGEAAYGSVGIAVVLSVFPRHLRASLSSAFIAGGAFGSVLGMAAGGTLSAQFGWRWAFAGMAIFGLVLVVIYRALITEPRLQAQRRALGEDAAPEVQRESMTIRPLLSALFSARSILCAYVGSALQLLVMGALLAWMPSFLSRYYGMATDRAGITAAAFVLAAGAGMVVCGALTDWVARHSPSRKWLMAIGYSVTCCVLLAVAFRLPAGTAQLALIGAGMLLVGGTAGPASAVVANLTRPAIHATAFATLTLANNLLGLAPGPFVTGVLADRIGLLGALQWIPLTGLLAAVCFIAGRRYYTADLERLERQRGAK